MSVFKRIRALLRDREGSTTVEFALWLPIFFMIFGVATDAALLMHRQTQLIDMARTASRQVSLGMATQAQAEAFVMSHFAPDSAGAATVSIADGYVNASITMPFSEVVIFSFFLTGDSSLNASITMVNEASASASS
ncbi:pilus assembly protein [Albimonas sp. CAU 1670]|uniref:TadE/TadG family type IV pilus assembly protein n=1 Tax=Albimonas sp. CAU 1670 TaxID=3032599 RepID=UPI0023DCBDF0|nr:TadE family protein [Albimonas sp. CAU 1670]MDF2235197.1 pilus assembly protein [Albimonas sp. CAU 1670]